MINRRLKRFCRKRGKVLTTGFSLKPRNEKNINPGLLSSGYLLHQEVKEHLEDFEERSGSIA